MIVAGAGVDIATHDHGGDGPPMLLTHGAGGSMDNLAKLIPHLTPSFRVVTFDYRNHGASGFGPWQWDAVLGDFDAVRVAYDLEAPIFAGHSLGGMIAVLYAQAYPEHTAAAINIDGQGLGRPDQYVGMTADEVAAAQARLRGVEEKFMPALAPEFLERRDEMLESINALDLFSLYRQVTRPLLLFNAHGTDPMTNIEGLEWIGDVMTAYRAGIARDLAVLEAECNHVTVASLDAPHMLVITHPAETADRMIRFAAN